MKSQALKITLTGMALSTLLAATSVNAGHYYEAVTTSNLDGKRDSTEVVVNSWVDGDNSRVEFVSGEKDGWMSDGNYLITTDGGENVFLVDPDEETYARFSLQEMMSTLGQAMDSMEQLGGMMKMEFTDLSTEKLLEEPGGDVLGYETTHYRYQTQYTMRLSIMGMKQKNTTVSVQDMWTTNELDAKGFAIWLRPDRGMQTGNDGLDELLDQEWSKINGFPLMITTDSTVTDKKGRITKNNSSTQVKVLREESVAADLFTWPENYTETQLIPVGGDSDQSEDDGKKKSMFDMFKKSNGGG